jgi:hypothetical protein
MNVLQNNPEHVSITKINVSKKAILIIATIVLGFFNLNATNQNKSLNSNTSIELLKDELITVYDWTVITTNGTYSGTATTLFEAKKRSNLVGQNEVVLERKITNYYVIKSDLLKTESRLYFWEVKSQKGYAKGYATTEASAKQMIRLVAEGDIISHKIIASGNKKNTK